MKLRLLVWFLIVFNILCGTLLVARAFGSGELTVAPTHDFQNGKGYTAEFNVEEHIKGNWYATPTVFLARLRNYEDTYGKLNFEYEWSDSVRTGIGYGFDNYLHYDEDKNLSHDIHGYVKLKLWGK